MNKASFMKDFDQINTAAISVDEAFDIAFKAEEQRDFSSMIGDIAVGLSSGTSGNRGVFLANENERAKWVASVLDRVIGLSFRKRSVAFFLRANNNLYESVKSKWLSFHYFDLLDTPEKHINRLNKLQPNILVAQPSLLLELAYAIEKNNLSIRPEKIISVAEVLYPEDKAYLQKVFKQNIHQVYQCTEGFLAATCPFGTLHFNEDFLIIEKKYIDAEQKRFHPVITDLERHTQPIIRYELNDIIIEDSPCPCGKKTTAIAQIEGRSDDVLKFMNKSDKMIIIYPDFIRRAIIFADASIRDYCVIQQSDQLILLFINADNEVYEKAKNALQNVLLQHEIVKVKINRIHSKQHFSGNKLRRIRNEQKQSN